jgi:DNA-directed RNA polymerase subunit E'/Rpb7
MFVLSIVKVKPVSSFLSHSLMLPVQQDKIPIHPSQFGLPPEQALIHQLNTKYANRVLHDVGLCICVFDVAEVGEGKVRYGDGFLWYTGKPLLSNTD